MLEVFCISYFMFHIYVFRFIFLRCQKLKPHLLFVFGLFLSKYSSKIFISQLCKIEYTKSKSSPAVSVAGPSVTG